MNTTLISTEKRKVFSGLKNLPTHVITCLIFATVWATYLMLHTFGYDVASQSMEVGGWVSSDFTAHIHVSRSFSMGENWPPEYPLFPHVPAKYHYGFYAMVGLFEKMGMRIDWALNLPSIFGVVFFVLGVFLLAARLSGDIRVAWLALVFLIFNGTLSFLTALKYDPTWSGTMQKIISAREFACFGPWSPCEVSACWNWNVLINQRHLALGLGAVIWMIYYLFHRENNNANPSAKLNRRYLQDLLVGAGIGILYSFHKPALLLAGVYWVGLVILSPKLFKPLLVIAVGIAITTAIQIIAADSLSMSSIAANQPSGAGIYWGYHAKRPFELIETARYWILNLGFHAILIPLGFWVLPKSSRRFIYPIFAVFIMGNSYKFASDVGTNHKFFNLYVAVAQTLSAAFLINIWDYASSMSKVKRVAMRSGIGIVIFFSTLSGYFDVFPVINTEKGLLKDYPKDPTMQWIIANTRPNSTFLNDHYIFSAPSITGRRIVMPWPYFIMGIGYDIDERIRDVTTIIASADPAVICPLLAKHKIDYVHLNEAQNDKNFPPANLKGFKERYKPVFVNPENQDPIYATTDMCPVKS